MNAKDILLIVIGLIVGVLVTLGIRSAIHDPYKPAHQDHQHGAIHAEPNTAPQTPMTPIDPHAGHGTSTPPANEPEPPANESETPAPVTTTHTEHSSAKPINTICAICGEQVDHSIPTITYKGHVIGFGCTPCPKKFTDDPERYLPYYLKNEVAPD